MHYNHVLHQPQKIKNILKDLEQLNIEKLILNEKLLKLGWKPKYDLRSGLIDALKWYKANKEQFNPNSRP